MTGEIIVAAMWGISVAALGAWLTELSPWYYGLRTPAWQPPDWLFGPAWSVILALGSLSAFLAWRGAESHASRVLVACLFIVNGALNILWSPLFFRLQRPDWALVELPFLWLSILVAMVLLARISGSASLLLGPYLVWVTFAAVLNLTIVRLNQPFGARARHLRLGRGDMR
jgi:translocator protein